MNTTTKVIQELEKARKQQAELAAKIKELEVAKEVLDNSAPEHKLAIMLHDGLCRYNHTDGCAWHYQIKKGIHDWSGFEHQQYLNRARTLVRRCENIGVDIEKTELIITLIMETR